MPDDRRRRVRACEIATIDQATSRAVALRSTCNHLEMDNDGVTVWNRLRQFAGTQAGPFTPQEALSWFRRHSTSAVNERTVRTHIRGACWNVENRAQFAAREPFLTRVDRGVFRVATDEELTVWRAAREDAISSTVGAVDTSPEGGHLSAARPTSVAEGARGEASLDGVASVEWHTESNVQSLLVTSLVNHGWRILSVANTATREHGIDVVAARGDQTVGIEVKGFPSRHYADPARAAQVKRTSPSTQAGHWYSQAVLAAMRLRGKEPTWRSVIALPDFPRYRDLYAETSGSLAAAMIEVWWIDARGQVDGDLHAERP